jgi:hypothetical protein
VIVVESLGAGRYVVTPALFLVPAVKSEVRRKTRTEPAARADVPGMDLD